MSVNWTRNQQKVIDTRGKNLLVSAAAGSGKTAVLVERIIQMITQPDNPVDVDKLLVVTFTNAAAAQMREKILEAIQNAIELQPDNEHLLRQKTYIHNAQITTIHSFCLSIIREHFSEIDIDPGFRVADEGELILLKSDIMKELLENYYESDREEFFEFIETYASGRGDENIEDLILTLYNFSMSHPWPEKWLKFCMDNYNMSEEKIESSAWMKNLNNYINMLLNDYKNSILNAIHICSSEGGPYMYLDALRDDSALIDQIIHTTEYDARVKLLSILAFQTLSRKKDENVDEYKREEVKAIRDKVKKGIRYIKDNYYFQTKEEMMNAIKGSVNPTNMLIELVEQFGDMYSFAKRDKNVVDFGDIEHMAFEILTKADEEGKTVPSLTAREIAGRFEEVIIDEYQDSNLLQELILKSVSREQFGRPNIFMVGDVKQSIYKFRMAKPEIFVEKYDNYPTADDGLYQRITLDKNFRSRENILKSINLIFSQIMARYMGEIEYDEDNALYPGADYKELLEGQTDDTEFLLIDTEGEDAKELEAQVIARRIREMVDINNGVLVTDKATGEYRRAKYSDIVILFRSLTGHAKTVEEILMAEGIPCYLETKEGYFDALEVRIILSLLDIIDNPIQDIPLAAVLKSPIAGFTSMDLAQIKVENPKESFYMAVKLYARNGADQNLRNKVKTFLDRLDEYRKKASYLSIYDLITYLLNDTGYLLYVTAMPSGESRKANLEMLKEKAAAYEKTSYTGVFNFIRYIEKLKKYQVDFAQASIISENDNTVRIMSIHKSKGLEFPIVILGGTGKSFNRQDITSKIVIHSEYGIGVDYVDLNARQKEQTLIKKSIALKLKIDNLSEELRILYVALTRAKEKLIITGSTKNLDKQIRKWMGERYCNLEKLPFTTLLGTGSYMDLIGFALIRHHSFAPIYRQMNIPVKFTNTLYDQDADIKVKYIKINDIIYEKVKDAVQKENLKENLLHWDTAYIYNEEVKNELEYRLQFKYPYESNKNIHTKMTVSEIKKLSQIIDEEGSVLVLKEEGLPDEGIPAFISGKEEISGSARGSAYHRVLEFIDFSMKPGLKNVEEFINKLVAGGKLREEAASSIKPSSIVHLLQSGLGARLASACRQNRLHREQQYVMGISAADINEQCNKEEIVLVQGIIDAYFEEDSLVIVDYKTDRVENADILKNRYKVQLDYYEKALEQITGKKVKEKIIYSLYLETEVVVP